MTGLGGVRILFATTRGAGHFGPLVPFAQALRRSGHEVLVAAPGSLRPHAERAGLPLAALAEPSEQVMAPVWERVRAAGPGGADRIVLEEIFAGEFARSALPGMLAIMREWRPDAVLRESTEFASLVAAEHLGVPHRHVSVFLTAGGEFDWSTLLDPVERLRAGAGLRREHGAEPFWRQPYLTMAPRSLEAPSAVAAGGHPALPGAGGTCAGRCRIGGRAANSRSSTSPLARSRQETASIPGSTARRWTRWPTCRCGCS